MESYSPRLGGNCNANNNKQPTRLRPVLPSKQEYDPRRYKIQGTETKKNTRSSSSSSRPLPAYQLPPVIQDWHKTSGSGWTTPPAREDDFSRTSSRPLYSGRLPRSRSHDRINDLTSSKQTPVSENRERQMSHGASNYHDSNRKRSKFIRGSPAASPGLSRKQSREETETERLARERGKSPKLKRSQSFSFDHGSNKYSEQRVSTATYDILTATRSSRDHSKTQSQQTLPCNISSNHSTHDSGSRLGIGTSHDTGRGYSPGSGSTRTKNTVSSSIVSSSVPHSRPQSPKPSLTTPSLPAEDYSHWPTSRHSTSSLAGVDAVTSPPSPLTTDEGYRRSTSSLIGGPAVTSPQTSTSAHSNNSATRADTISSPPLLSTRDRDNSQNHRPRNTSLQKESSKPSPSPKQDNKLSSKSLFPEAGGRVGLGNLGNTCFMNSMLQCLGQTGEMARIFLEMRDNSYNKTLVKAYRELMQQMWSGKDSGSSSLLSSSSIYPRTLRDAFSRKNPQFSGFNQHDSQEFMRFLVSGLHEELKEPLKTKPTVPQEPVPEQWWTWYRRLEKSELVDVFVGQLRSTLTCSTCRHCSDTFDPFWELSVSLPSNRRSSTYSTTYSSSHGSGVFSSSSSSSGVCLQDCLDIFTQEEQLDGDEKPYCEKCRQQEPGVKRMTIQRLPPVLIIHLKRFSAYGRRSKLDTSVTIPHTLNVSQYLSSTLSQDISGTDYELYGVSNHSGSAFFGHYTAWCKHYSSGKWFSYNDNQVSSLTVQTPTFSSSTAYVLFYRQMRRESRVTRI